MVIFFGMSLVTVPEAARILRRSPRHLRLFCLAVSGGLALLAVAWGIVLLAALPRGLGEWLFHAIWRPTYPLVLPLAISVVGACVAAGAGTGLHALGAARRSLRAMVLASAVYVACSLAGAAAGGAMGTVRGAAIATWLGALLWWRELHAELREYGHDQAGGFALSGRPPGRHRMPDPPGPRGGRQARPAAGGGQTSPQLRPDSGDH
jgi:O-antigen/teichoic acid export membrane protein